MAKSNKGNGLGHLPSVLEQPARGTTTKTKAEKIRQKDRKAKANGWAD